MGGAVRPSHDFVALTLGGKSGESKACIRVCRARSMKMFAKFIAAITHRHEDTPPAVVELGLASIRSALGQPLMIDLPLMNAANIDPTKLRLAVEGVGRMRDGDATDAGFPLAITPALRKTDDGQYFIRLAGRRPMLKPFVNLLVALDGPSGRISRRYDLQLPAAELETSAGATEPAQVATAVEPVTAPSPDSAAPPSPSPVRREAQPMNPPDRRTAEQAWLDEQIAPAARRYPSAAHSGPSRAYARASGIRSRAATPADRAHRRAGAHRSRCDASGPAKTGGPGAAAGLFAGEHRGVGQGLRFADG